ncbi:4-diphosphocytidyl-2C-methyl-D-erythritol synthase [Bacillus freudenreichii]|nr:4-diphosphocytidyl-2C-methyl-D-erythritol synthase [Bacillus freudenreichii]
MRQTTSAIILAAGTSSRMGTAKQLLPLGERPMLAHVIDRTLAEDFSEIIAVIGHKAEAIRHTICIEDSRFQWVVNNDYSKGQGTSLKLAMSQINEHHSGVMVFLGDLPFMSQKTICDIYELGNFMLTEKDEPFVLQPSYKGTAGHPVFFGHVKAEWFQEIQGDQGAKAIMDRFPIRRKLPVEDQGILYDIDTPDAYDMARKIYRQI